MALKKVQYQRNFGSFGGGSVILSPLRIDNPKCIFIGKGVIIQHQSWIASVPLTGEENSQLVIEDGAVIGNFNHIYATKSIIIHKKVLTADKVYISDNLRKRVSNMQDQEQVYYHDHGDGHVHSHQVEHSHEHGEHSHVHTQTKAVLNRLSRAIGHLESVKRMVEDGRDCTEVLVQLAAVRSALSSTAKVILKDHLEHCVPDAQGSDLQALNEAIDKFM